MIELFLSLSKLCLAHPVGKEVYQSFDQDSEIGKLLHAISEEDEIPHQLSALTEGKHRDQLEPLETFKVIPQAQAQPVFDSRQAGHSYYNPRGF